MSNERKESDVVIDAVFFAQTHVMEPHHPYFKLTEGKGKLIKVHVISPTGETALEVTVTLTLNEESTVLELEDPKELPKSVCKEPGTIVHKFDNRITATIPGTWILKNLKLTICAGEAEKDFDSFNIGPPTVMEMMMFDVHYFGYADVEYVGSWAEELVVKWLIKALEVQKLKRIHFPKFIIPPRGKTPAILCTSEEDYEKQAGDKFNGKQSVPLTCQKTLRDSGDQKHLFLNLINIPYVKSGGFAESKDFGGCGALGRFPVLHHELRHALDVGFDPTDGDAYQTRKVNLPVRDGEIEKVELLHTPDTAINCMLNNPRMLYDLDCKDAPAEGTREHFSVDLS